MATVLIVDDDKFTRSVLQAAFARDPAFAELKIETLTAANGRDGLDIYRAQRPEVVITDLVMPEVDGYTLCRAIRHEPEGPAVHLVAMSGIYRDAQVTQRVHDEFDAEFFAKPYQLRDLTRHVATVLALEARGEDSRRISVLRLPLATELQSGDLARRPLPAVLLDLVEHSASGHLTLRRGRVSKVVELVVGHPLSVSSTARDEALGHFLVAFGVITDDQHKRAVKWAARNKEKVADALIGLGILSPEEMVARLTMQTCYKLVQSLRWPDGNWRFQPQKDPPAAGPRGNPIDMVALVLQGLRQTASIDIVPERVAALGDRPLVRTARGHTLWPAVRQYLSDKLANAWVDGAPVDSLLGADLERGELFMLLEALMLCDAVTPGEAATMSAVPERADDARDSSATHPGDYSVEELSELSHSKRFLRPRADTTGELYASLFDDVNISASPSGDLPIELPDEELDPIDSGVLDIARLQQRVEGTPTTAEVNFARRMLLKEYLRIQGQDHYGVVRVDRDASRERIASALDDRKTRLSMDWFARFDLGRDYAKLEEIHAAYERAGKTLLDDKARAAYDRGLRGDEGQDREPGLDAEIAYHAGHDLLQHGSYEGAIEHLQAAVAAAPDEADYHAALGWAHYLKGGRTPPAADQARPHLNQGLAINPDHAPSHEYKGLISEALGTDHAEAIFHLERALDADPTRTLALEALERIHTRRGELRPLERLYRRLIYRTAGSEPAVELDLWIKLADLYRLQLRELDNAQVAYESAARLAPDDPRVQAALENLLVGASDRFVDHAERLRLAWRRDPLTPRPGLQLVRAALAASRPDAAFMAASALVARGLADSDAETLYKRYRPRFVIRAQRTFLDGGAGGLWDLLRHPDDHPELGALFHILAPVMEAAFPLTLADLDMDESMAVDQDDLPEPFVRVCTYVARMLGVTVPPVLVRPEFGHQVHVGAVSPPVLLAGDDILLSPERSELAFRLGRAMTFLMPGRTFAGSRPSRLLRAAILAVFTTLSPGVDVPDREGHVARLRDHLDALTSRDLGHAQMLVAELTRQGPALNLSVWARALGRSADRVGLILCGDLPAAARFVRDSSDPEVVDDLIDYALSSACWSLRDQLGLSIDV